MERERRNNLMNEIKQIERELYLKRSQLASSEALEDEARIYKESDYPEWKKTFSRCIEEVGRLSGGGNSVEDVASERRR